MLNKSTIALTLMLGCAVTTVAAAQDAGGAPTLRIIDVNATPWDTPRDGAGTRLKTKTLFKTSGHGRLVYYFFPPTWDDKLHPAGSPENSARPHYHEYHEWGYVLGGDYILHEPVSAFQRNPAVFRYVEGTWLSRQAFSLHSGDWATGGVRSQNPASMIILEEGEISSSLLPGGKLQSRSSKTRQVTVTTPTESEWASKGFTHPWIVHSGEQMEWEIDPKGNGRLLKWLSDDPVQGFRAQLVKVPPGWTPSTDEKKTYFDNAHRIRYMLYGDLRVVPFNERSVPGQPLSLNKDVIVHQPARSIWAYADGVVTEGGAVWLEVTYANGLALSKGPIEQAKVVR